MTLRCEAALLAGGSDFTVAAGGEQVKKHIRAQYDVKKWHFCSHPPGRNPQTNDRRANPDKVRRLHGFTLYFFLPFMCV